MSTYKLRTIGPPHEAFILKTGAYRLGSASDSEMVIGDMSVAPYHCEIVVTGKTISVRNLSAKQEMHVDGQLVQSASLNLGQTLKLGNVTLILEEPTGAAAASSPSSGQAQPMAVAVAKRSAALLKPYVLPGLAFLGAVSIGVLIWFSTRQESRTGPAVPAAKQPRVKPKPAEVKAATAASGKSDASDADESDANPAGSPGAAASKPPREKPAKPFDPNDSTVLPAVDIETADGHLKQREFNRAEPFIQRALKNQVKSLGLDDPEVAKTIDKLGRTYQESGQFSKAEPCFKQVLTSAEKNRGPEHPETAAAMNNLGELHLAASEPSKAAPFLEQALKIREKALGAGHPDVGSSLTNLAAMNLAEGELGKAAPQLERALKTFEANFGAKHPAVAQCLTDLGATHLAMNDAAKAEPFLQRALELKEQTLPPDDPALLPALNNLAAVGVAKGEFEKAEALLERGLKNAEKNFGPDDPKTAESLDKLADLHQQKGDPAKALPLAERAEKIDEKSAGPDSPETAESLEKVAKLHQALNDAAQAKPLLERSSNVLAKALGPEHPRSQKNLEDLADLNACEGDQSQGPQLAKQAIRGKLRLLTTFLAYASESQRLASDDLLNPYNLAAFINSAPEMALAVLRYKGVVLDSLLEDRLLVQSGRDPKDQAMIGELFSLRGKMAALHFGVSEDLSSKAQEQRQNEKNKLAKEAEVIESILGHRVAGLGRARNAVNVTVEQVQNAIPAQAALLELVRYSRCLGVGKWEPCYGAVMLTSTGNPLWVPLGSAEAIDGNIERVQNAVRTRRVSPDQASKASEELSTVLQELAKQLWMPVEALLPAGVKTLIVCPDGALNFMPYATLLLPGDQFLGQKYAVRYVSSGRDLLTEKKSARRGQALIFCNADFAARGLSAAQASGSGPASIAFPARRDLESLRLTPLPGTLGESALAEAFIKRLNAPVQVLGGSGASEAQLAAVQSPRILHLATHAFALPGNGRSGSHGSGSIKQGRASSESEKLPGAPAASDNPAHRSGLALAGAQTTLQAWSRNEIPVGSQDGIVTAAEVGTLKLAGTELVVLSGCDARIGSDRGGEAVLALRRGFVQAGAENLVMTLWPATDPATIEMIGNFYERLQQPGGVAQAFSDVQRESLVRLRKDRGLETAVRLAGAFVLSSQGR